MSSGKKIIHFVILDRMKDFISFRCHDSVVNKKLREAGSLLEESLLPEDRKDAVAVLRGVRDMISDLTISPRNEKARLYLADLMVKLEKGAGFANSS